MCASVHHCTKGSAIIAALAANTTIVVVAFIASSSWIPRTRSHDPYLLQCKVTTNTAYNVRKGLFPCIHEHKVEEMKQVMGFQYEEWYI